MIDKVVEFFDRLRRAAALLGGADGGTAAKPVIKSTSQVQVEMRHLERFLHRFTPHQGLSADDWAKRECAELMHGTVLFWLAPNNAAINDDTTFGAGPTCIVVGFDADRPIAAHIGSTVFEMRIAEILLLELAKQAEHAKEEIFYVMAEPIRDPNCQKLEQLGAQFANGGKRTAERDPAKILLGAIGFDQNVIDDGNGLVALDRVFEIVFGSESDTASTLVPVPTKASSTNS